MPTLSPQIFSCDLDSGLCAPSIDKGLESISLDAPSKVRMYYFTDPICSHCWAIEPQLLRFKLEYGEQVEIIYKMGGLLPGWKGFADVKNGISGPSDVAPHWDEVGQHSGMSIDGDVWLEDPLDSSYPPSIAFKAVEFQGSTLAQAFLRRIREMVFLERKNICREEHLKAALTQIGGDVDRFIKDFQGPQAEKACREDLRQRKNMGVRGFPTFIFAGKGNQGFRMKGSLPYDQYAAALEKVMHEEANPSSVELGIAQLLSLRGFLATQELTVALDLDREEALTQLNLLVEEGKVREENQKFGSFWRWLG